MNNIKMITKTGINKKGQKYGFIIFEVNTPSGIYSSGPVFPSALEFSILSKMSAETSNTNNANTNGGNIGAIYSNSDTSLENEF